MLDMTEGPRTALTERFPDASSDALDLLAKMLTFDPARRISVRDAMRHPWLSRFYQVRFEIIRMCVRHVFCFGWASPRERSPDTFADGRPRYTSALCVNDISIVFVGDLRSSGGKLKLVEIR